MPTSPQIPSAKRRPLPAVVAIAFASLIAMFAVVANPAQASPENPAGDEQAYIAALNQVRADAGLPALIPDAQLSNLSRGWAQEMANAGKISHANPISAGITADWRKVGENVGTGGDVAAIMNAFVNSPGHYKNIVDPDFTYVGVGVVWNGNAMYTTHRFMKVADSAPAPQPAPVPDPAPAPSPPAPSAPRASTPPDAASPTTAAPTTTSAPPPPPPAATPERVATLLTALRNATI